MMRPTRIQQPGAAAAQRICAVEARGRAITIDLDAGTPLLAAVARGFAAAGAQSGAVELGALALAPFAYVMPALSSDGRHAAFYSQTFRPPGVTRLEAGAMTFGRRDGGAFFHAHAFWRGEDGSRGGGHILPEETIVAAPACVTAFALDGAAFEATQDAETNFKLFEPSPVARRSEGGVRALALRVRPNIDLGAALAEIAARHGFRRARVRGGVGSIIGARFEGGETVPHFATEAFIRQGTIEADASGSLCATLDVDLVDYRGGLAGGRLARGDNPVLMTFELALEELPG